MTSDTPGLYRHRPLVVAAVQAPVRGEHEAEKDFEERLRKVVRWIFDEDGEADMTRTHLRVVTANSGPEGSRIKPGSWVVRTDAGEWWILSDENFNARYAKVN